VAPDARSLTAGPRPFLRMPPFPGARAGALAAGMPSRTAANEQDPSALAQALASARVGGAFWAAQPDPQIGRNLLLAPSTREEARLMLAQVKAEGVAQRVLLLEPAREVDPWHIADHAAAIWVGADHELTLVGALAGKPIKLFGSGRFSALGDGTPAPEILHRLVAEELTGRTAYTNPFTGKPMDALVAIAMLAEWRRLIDRNRHISAVYGIARWKRATVDALLWAGEGRPPYARKAKALAHGDTALVWKSRAPAHLPGQLESQGVAVGEIEDGFIRSTGLGANCVPPLSIVVDHLGIYFDPSQPSDLEDIIQNAEISPELVERAVALRKYLVQAGVSKYGRADMRLERPAGLRRTVLVTGQVEDDRSVMSGGGGCTNLGLLQRARSLESDAYLIYKPHPDVEAGHRKGRVAESDILASADRIEREAPIAALLDSVDAIHVITSLAGFEGLMRGKEVTTHGVPFFAGWGLTRDLGPVPARRTKVRSLDELVAAALILYPRYLDPVTRLPCPPEVLIDRMATNQADIKTPLVRLRQIQGRLNAMLQHIRRRG
jgi:capsular polysaccharide export protein